MECIIALSNQTVGDNNGNEHIDKTRDSINQSSHIAKSRPTTRDITDEANSEDEFGALVYQQSHIAKARTTIYLKAKAKRTIPNEESNYTSLQKKNAQ